MRCSKCGADNEPEFRFCGTCGTPLPLPIQPSPVEDEIEREVADLRTASTPAGKRRPLLSFEEELQRLTVQGWQILDRNDTSAQLKKPRQWSRVGLLVFVLLPLMGGLIFVLVDYLLRKDKLVYLSAAGPSRGEFPSLDENTSWTGPLLFGGILILCAALYLFGFVWFFNLALH